MNSAEDAITYIHTYRRRDMVLYNLLLIYVFVDIGYMKFNPEDYCSIHCGKHLDTVCENMKPKPYCSTLPLGTPMDRKLRNLILNGHNEFRNRLAGGEVDKFPMATNMKLMMWNEELEFMAQAWVSQCTFHYTIHDFCRLTLNKSRAGQILWHAASEGTKAEKWKVFLAHISDPKHFNYEYPPDGMYNHSYPNDDIFGQAIWAETSQVGCAFAEEPTEKLHFYVVCDYLCEGCFMDQIIYKAGGWPCSECDDGEFCDNTYPNLCAIPDMLSTPEPEISPTWYIPGAGIKFKAYMWVHLPVILLAVLIT